MTALVIADSTAKTLPPEADYAELIVLETTDVVVIECQFCASQDTSDEAIDKLMEQIGTDAQRAQNAYQRYAILSVRTDCEACHARYQHTAIAFQFHQTVLELRGTTELKEVKRCVEQRWAHFARMGYKPASSR